MWGKVVAKSHFLKCADSKNLRKFLTHLTKLNTKNLFKKFKFSEIVWRNRDSFKRHGFKEGNKVKCLD